MKRPAKSNYETVVVERSDFNQTAFNLPDPPKSVHIKTVRQDGGNKKQKKTTANGHSGRLALQQHSDKLVSFFTRARKRLWWLFGEPDLHNWDMTLQMQKCIYINAVIQ